MVRQTGINLENVKTQNKSAVLKLLNRKGAMSRKDIAKEVGLTPAAVTILCTEMMEQGFLIEKGELQEEKRAGRKKILVDIAYDCKYIVSVSIERKKTYISICDLKGRICAGRIIQTDTSVSAEEFLKRIEKECKSVLWENEISHKKILGMGICIPGIVDREKGISLDAYGIWRENIPIRAIMEGLMQCPVIVENNVKAFAEGELLYGIGKKGENLLFVKWGPGVGSAIVIQDRLYEGRNNNAAEFGHYIVNPNGVKCRCGRTGCLETEVSTRAILNKICAVYSKENTPVLYAITEGRIDLLSEENFIRWLDNKGNEKFSMEDEVVWSIIAEKIDSMARALANVITILAPEHTILFGFMLENKKIRDAFLEYCNKYGNGKPMSISKSNMSNKIYYIGATAIVSRELFFEG